MQPGLERELQDYIITDKKNCEATLEPRLHTLNTHIDMVSTRPAQLKLIVSFLPDFDKPKPKHVFYLHSMLVCLSMQCCCYF